MYTTIEMEGKPFQVRTIYYRQRGEQASFDSKPTQRKTVVLTHGYMSCCTTFARLLALLGKHYDIVLFDNCSWGLNTRLETSNALKSKQDAIKWMTEFM